VGRGSQPALHLRLAVSAPPDPFSVRLAMDIARRRALEDRGDPLQAVRGLYREASPRPVPAEAVQPWPDAPPRDQCAALPARWAALRAARDPRPEVYYGTGPAMDDWPRGIGYFLETALRACPADCWWYDPALPLALIQGGFPEWDRDGRRRDTGENAQEFAALVRDYERELRAGLVFPPLLVIAVEPGADRAAVGLQRWLQNVPRWWTGRNHYIVANGRHRAAAAWRTGRRALPAFAAGPGRALYEVACEHGDDWLHPVCEIASERGRGGMRAAELAVAGQAGDGRVRIRPDV
jgi:hypothetical protein